jgi:uncharacterized membrane protein
MNLLKTKAVLLVLTAALALFVASPALQRILISPQTDLYTELWLLDSAHSANNYPFNVTSDTNYTLYLDVANHLGYCGYYVIEVKLRNEVMPYPGSFNHTPINLPSLYNLTTFVPNKSTLEIPLQFSIKYISDWSKLRVNFTEMTLNNVNLNLTGYSTVFRPQAPSGFFGNVYFELWLYNTTSGELQYNHRYVNLPLNMTVLITKSVV